MKKIIILLFLTVATHALYAQKSISNSAQEIFKKSETAYAGLNTYVDSGKVINEFYNNKRPHKSSLIFRTAYSKQLGFNFDFFEPNRSNSLYTINKQADRIQTWWGVTAKTETKPSLSMALAGATGVSFGVASLVPRFLFTQELKQRNFFQQLIAAELAGDEKVNNNLCFVIKGKRLSENITVWVSKSDYLIRKIETVKLVDPKILHPRTDSLMNSRLALLKKQASSETDTVKRSKLLRDIKTTEDRIKSSKRVDSISLLVRDGREPESFSVKTTVYYYPSQPVNPDKKVFTFRPNREVEL